MKSSIDFLPKGKQDELKQLVDVILGTFSRKVDMIILYGSYARDTWVEETDFDENGTRYSYISDFDILVVTTSESRARNKNFAGAVRDIIRAHLDINTPVSLIFHGYDYICQMLAEKQYFFYDIYHEGIILDNNGDRHFKEPENISYALRAVKSQEYYDQWFNSAREFLANYYFNYERAVEAKNDMEKYKLASFNLHQAAERFYTCILLIFTDYKGKTHDLKILDKACCDYDSRFRKAFPRETKKEKDLFQLLREAYIGSRYKLNFKVTKEQLEYLVERVEELKKLADEICKEKIKHFKEVGEKHPEKIIVSEKPNLETANNYGSKIARFDPDDKQKFQAGVKIGKKEGRKEGLAEGRESGIAEGERKKSLEIVKNMLDNNLSIEQINQFTNIDISELEKLIRKINKKKKHCTE